MYFWTTRHMAILMLKAKIACHFSERLGKAPNLIAPINAGNEKMRREQAAQAFKCSINQITYGQYDGTREELEADMIAALLADDKARGIGEWR